MPYFRRGRFAGTRLKHNDRLLLGVFNAIHHEVHGEVRIGHFEDIWNRLHDWENELNRRQMDLEDPAWRERSQAEAEAAHAHRIWQIEIERSKRLAYQRRVRAELKRQREKPRRASARREQGSANKAAVKGGRKVPDSVNKVNQTGARPRKSVAGAERRKR